MADEHDTSDGGPHGGEPRPPGRGSWLRWGSVYVDIEPPAAVNPWTAPGSGPPPTPPDVGPPTSPSAPRRNAALVMMAAVVAALLGFLLVAAFTRHDRPPALAVVPSTTRPRPTTAATRPPAVPSTSPTTVPRPAAAPTTAAGATTTVGRAGGTITIPEGVPPSSPVAPGPVAPTTAAPSTTTIAGPRAFLGVTVEETFGEGALVVDVLPSTGAAAAGLLPGDVITAIDATAVASPDELGEAIVAHRPGDSVTVSVLRNGATVTVRAALGVRP